MANVQQARQPDDVRAAVVVLAGGRSTRMGTDKAALRLQGRSLLSRVVSAAARVGPVVVVAPDGRAQSALDDAAAQAVVAVVLEDPPLGGPVAGIAAGLAALPDGVPQVVVLACDLPRADDLVPALAVDLPAGVDLACPVDDEGFAQLLAARYRVDALRTALAALPGTRDVSVRRMARPLRRVELATPRRALADVDDADAAARHGIELP